MKRGIRMTLIVAGGLIVLFLLIQLIPFGRDHTNPAVTGEPTWDSPQTRALAQRACFDCHSNETIWPWYSNIAPVSWLVYYDVAQGRQELNFSEWNAGSSRGARDLGEVLQGGEMPPLQYTLIHPAARLSAAEKQALSTGLQNSLH